LGQFLLRALIFTMGSIMDPSKRVLADSTNSHRNLNTMPGTAKRRKLDPGPSPVTPLRGIKTNDPRSSGQQKSQFEHTLEKMTQDLNEGKENTAEKDQQWDRPPVKDFDPKTHDLCFQQIEAEEGTLFGGRATVKLFGVTEVWGP
jgi:DNA polymerase delta subunit 1